MKDYLKNHWIVFLLIILVWSLTIFIIISNKKTHETLKQDHVEIIRNKDSVLQATDTILVKLENLKKNQQELRKQDQQIKELKKEKVKIKIIEKSKIVEREKILEKEKVVEKKIYIHDTIYQKVEVVKYINPRPSRQKSDRVGYGSSNSVPKSMEINSDSVISVDTTKKKKGWFKRMFTKG